MTNKIQPAEIADCLNDFADDRELLNCKANIEILRAAAEIVRKVDKGELVEVVRCGECKHAYIAPDCGRKCKHISGKPGYCLDGDFCSEGEEREENG